MRLRPPVPSTSAVWSQSCRGKRRKKKKKNYKNKAKELGKDADESVGDAVHRRKTNKKRFTSITVNAEKYGESCNGKKKNSRENCALPCLPNRRFASDPTEGHSNAACRYCRVNSSEKRGEVVVS